MKYLNSGIFCLQLPFSFQKSIFIKVCIMASKIVILFKFSTIIKKVFKKFREINPIFLFEKIFRNNIETVAKKENWPKIRLQKSTISVQLLWNLVKMAQQLVKWVKLSEYQLDLIKIVDFLLIA